MNVDLILNTFNSQSVAYILIGGMNFLLRHGPILTYDVDLWIDDAPENLGCCEKALAELQAEWGSTEQDWGPVAKMPAGWLARQSVFCLTSPFGAIDIFRAVAGLASWFDARGRAHLARTAAGTPYVGLSDQDMLDCQLALPESRRNAQRVQILTQALKGRQDDGRTA